MKTIGLIGGMSWESSVHYYRLINQSVRAARGGIASAPLVMHSFDFAEIAALQSAGEWDALGDKLADAGRGLHGAGAEALLICTNTMHKLAEQVDTVSPARLIHIVDPLADAVLAAGHRKLGLLGTRFTMNEPFYSKRLAAKGLEVILPAPEARDELNRIIFEELCAGTICDKARSFYCEVIADMAARGAEAVALACTEIMLLVKPCDSSLPVFDTTELHAAAAVDFILS
ncbi:aspartate/glutamate racemase family protein [Qipengyuania marisflavi]|uniref:Aspartate/glutamate racemase family protein n=1 Tax=Qipengyuania marisflavi TaxID=2486356 RepID=A0A5S3PY47_9SPHN|nr:aspartate/glutamate racemase family protein [Qipengyuania marisflavi]TMM48696.1 aspartate/glutamate racemase family protein [Qipengyuania marisflavi]